MEPRCLAKNLLALKYHIGNLPFAMMSLELFNELLALSLPFTLDRKLFVGLVIAILLDLSMVSDA